MELPPALILKMFAGIVLVALVAGVTFISSLAGILYFLMNIMGA